MSGRDCPCRDCVPPTRTVGCHSACQRYTDWKTAHDAKVARIKQLKNEEAALFPRFNRRRMQ